MKVFLLFFIVINLSFVFATEKISKFTKDKLKKELSLFNMSVGNEVLIRIFKKESRLELWARPENNKKFSLFKTYPICYYSGDLGPKLHEGDKVTPEGFYSITKNRLNPNSRYYLSMNIGYPNNYDKQLSRTGSLLMIHGACDSVGCFAMTNSQIEEIYYLVEKALDAGQDNVPVYSFPFRLSNKNLIFYKNNKWFDFWKELQSGYILFNKTRTPLKVIAIGGHYLFSSPSN